MSGRTAELFRFPDPVNEVSARLVATGVVLMALTWLVTGWTWLLAVLAYGFVARVLTGPALSPLGQLVTRVLTPRVPAAAQYTPGPPKRFAQGIGAVMSVGALAAVLAGVPAVAVALIALLAACAFLEAAFGLCLGCVMFAGLIRLGVVPEETCARCADLWGTGRTDAA